SARAPRSTRSRSPRSSRRDGRRSDTETNADGAAAAMAAERATVGFRHMTFELGTYGVWHPARFTDVAFATEIERLGYRTLWLGGSPDGNLALVDELLAATNSLRVATGIVNVWNDRADVVAESFA